jgi:hypothetical protein
VIRWTTAGAVATPRALQIRVGARVDGRLRAGAPTPSRALTIDEVARNVEHFTVRREGPRARAVHTLVLSAVGDADARQLAAIVREARDHHIRRVVVHAARDVVAVREGPLGHAADQVVAVVDGSSDEPVPAGVLASVPLNEATVAELPSLLPRLASAAEVVFTWPFPVPGSPPPPPAPTCMAAVRSVAPRLTVPWGVKGLPVCVWGDDVPFAPRRTSNRFYVDAEHQLADALMFFPDVVAWAKPDTCRRCRVDVHCDGAVGAWLDQGLLPRLEPLEEAP